MTGFTILGTDPLTLEHSGALSGMYTLSPYIWRDSDQYQLLLRVVPHADDPAKKIARIHCGRSRDGLRFAVDASPVLAPGPAEVDRGGCEDPTALQVDDGLYVYYSGLDEKLQTGSLLLAVGPDARRLTKRGPVLEHSSEYANPKEATVVRLPDGTWRLFFEYASEGASKIGIATSPAVDGPWSILASFVLARPDGWDSWHLSPGPVLGAGSDRPTMFYNGAPKNAHWRIGWIVFDSSFSRIIGRSDEPLIVPPQGEAGDTDIAFAASCVERGDEVSLYYSIADKDSVCARLRRI